MKAAPKRTEQEDRQFINETSERVGNKLFAVLTADLERAAQHVGFQDDENVAAYSTAVLAATIDVVATQAAVLVVKTKEFGSDDQMVGLFQVSERLRPQLARTALALIVGEQDRCCKNGSSPRIGVNTRPN
jgi:hypothetical protein